MGNGNGKANEDKKKNNENTKRRERGSVKNSSILPSQHASAKKSTYDERRAVFDASDLI